MKQSLGGREVVRIGDSEEMSFERQNIGLVWGTLMIASMALGGCSSSITDYLPGSSTSAEAPQHSKDADGYLPVHDLPPDRREAIMAPAERAKIEAELLAARNRQPPASAKDASSSSK